MFRTLAISLTLGTTLSLAQAETTPDAFVMTLSTEVIDAVKADKAIQAGDVSRIRTLVDTKVLPNVNLQRMVVKSVGQPWRSATPEQQKRLTEEFKTYLINTYDLYLEEPEHLRASEDLRRFLVEHQIALSSPITPATLVDRRRCSRKRSSTKRPRKLIGRTPA